MILESIKLGTIEVEQDHLITFPNGIPGFEQERQFAIVGHGEESPFIFLQSVHNRELTFVCADPFSFFCDYQVELDDRRLEEMELSNQNPPYILCLVTVPDVCKKMTINLLAPIIINWKKQIANQIILEGTVYVTRHPLFPEEGNAEGEGDK